MSPQTQEALIAMAKTLATITSALVTNARCTYNLMMAYQLRVSPIYNFVFVSGSFPHSLLPPTTNPLGMWQPSVKTWFSRTR